MVQVDIEDSGPNQKTVKVTVPQERVQDHLNKVYKAANEQVRLKGFRPGKVPRRILREKLGDQILGEAKQSIIQETFQEALRSSDLDIVGQPRLDVSEEPLDEKSALSYSVCCDLRPEVEIGNIADIEIEGQSTVATDEDLESSLEQLAKSKRKLQAVDDALGEGDFAKVDMTYTLDGTELVKKDGLQINANIPVRGCDPQEFQARLVGQPAGESITLPIHYPDTFEKEEARGKEGELTIQLNEILRFVPPPLDDEFAKGFEFESMDKLREDLRTKISAEKERQELLRREEEILDTLFKEHPYVVPKGLIEEEARARAENAQAELERQGAPKEEAQKRVKEAKGELREAAERGVRNLFLIEAISKKHKLFVTETDVDKELRRIASENDAKLDEVKQYFEEKELYPELRLEMMNRKVREFLRQTAKITDETPGEASAEESTEGS